MRKKYIRILIIVLVFAAIKQVCFGISDNFKFVIDTVGIPRYNVLGEEINEYVYYTYNVFSYSSPTSIPANVQRFKEVQNNGKWNNGGVKGEYDILGRDYSGNYIYNVYFPVDAIPETTPDKWNYINIAGSRNSWEDTNKYKYKEQLEYMKNSKLLFDSINYSNNTINPYDLVQYDITANKIGLDKVVLNTVATWKTYGIVSVNRLNNKGQVRYATLAVKPMAASANVKSLIISPEKIVLDEDSDEVTLNLTFGAKAVNLNDYAKKDHIKEMNSDLYINGKKVSTTKDGKNDKILKTYLYKISRDNFSPGNHTLKLSCNSYLYTEFSVDGLMQDKREKEITIQINPKKVVPIKDVEVKVLEKNNNEYVLTDFIQTKFTKEADSKGLIEKEKHISLKLSKGDSDFKKENLKLYIDNEIIPFEILKENDKSVIVDVKIPNNVNPSILSWETYRNNSDSYFKIDFDNIGNRIKSPNILKLTYQNGKEYNQEIKIDTIDSYKYNFNYTFENNVEVYNYNKIKLDDWINE